MRNARSVAWVSTAGFHQRSKWITCEAAVKFKPVPPALSDRMKNGGPSSLWKCSTRALRFDTLVPPCNTTPPRPKTTARWAPSGSMISRNCVKINTFSWRAASSSQISATEEFATIGGLVFAVAGKLTGVVEDLLQAQQRLQHQPPTRHAIDRFQRRLQRVHSMLVEFYLWPGQVAVTWRLGLLRQVGDNRPIRFQTAQDVWPYQLAQRRKLVLLTRLQAFHE